MRALPFQQLHGPRAMVKRKGLFFDLRLELKCSPIGCRKADSYLVVESIFVRVAIRGRCKTRHQRDLRELMLLARSPHSADSIPPSAANRCESVPAAEACSNWSA